MSARSTAFSTFGTLVLLAGAFAIQPPAAQAIPTLILPSTSGFASFNSSDPDSACPLEGCSSLSGGNSSASFTASFSAENYLYADFLVYAGEPISSIDFFRLAQGGSGPCGPCYPIGSGSLTVGATTYEMSAEFFIGASSGSAIVPSGYATMTFPASMGGGGFACTSIGPETSPCVPGLPSTVIIPYADVGFGDISGSMTFTFTPFTIYASNAETFSAVFTPSAPTPEPSSSVLLIIGLAGVAARRLRKRGERFLSGAPDLWNRRCAGLCSQNTLTREWRS
jgi:hypothetical protein